MNNYLEMMPNHPEDVGSCYAAEGCPSLPQDKLTRNDAIKNCCWLKNK